MTIIVQLSALWDNSMYDRTCHTISPMVQDYRIKPYV